MSLLNRLAAAYGEAIYTDRTSLHAFPRPQDLAGLEPLVASRARFQPPQGNDPHRAFPGGCHRNLARWLGLESPLDYHAVGQAVSRWQPYAGMIYFHLLLDRLEAAGELDGTQEVPGVRSPDAQDLLALRG